MISHLFIPTPQPTQFIVTDFSFCYNMEKSIDHKVCEKIHKLSQDEGIQTPLIVKQNKESSFTELVFQFPTPSIFPIKNTQVKKSSESGEISSRSAESNQKYSNFKNQSDAKTFLTLPGLNSATKFANAINSLPSPICPVSTPLPLTSIGNF